jgi:tight adherence protein B
MREGTGLVAALVGLAVLGWPAPGAAGARVAALDVFARSRNWRDRASAASTQPAPGPERARRVRRRPALPWSEAALVPVLEGLAATLRAGLTPARALHYLASTQGLVEPGAMNLLVRQLATQAAAGSPLEPVWRREAQVRGSPALLAVAEGWALTERHGAPLVDVLDVVVGALRDAARTDAAVETALAAPRATARLLGVLPLGGLVLGELVGVHPVSVLLGTAAGRVVGCAGLGCTLAGRMWMRRLVAGVTAR